MRKDKKAGWLASFAATDPREGQKAQTSIPDDPFGESLLETAERLRKQRQQREERKREVERRQRQEASLLQPRQKMPSLNQTLSSQQVYQDFSRLPKPLSEGAKLQLTQQLEQEQLWRALEQTEAVRANVPPRTQAGAQPPLLPSSPEEEGPLEDAFFQTNQPRVRPVRIPLLEGWEDQPSSEVRGGQSAGFNGPSRPGQWGSLRPSPAAERQVEKGQTVRFSTLRFPLVSEEQLRTRAVQQQELDSSQASRFASTSNPKPHSAVGSSPAASSQWGGQHPLSQTSAFPQGVLRHELARRQAQTSSATARLEELDAQSLAQLRAQQAGGTEGKVKSRLGPLRFSLATLPFLVMMALLLTKLTGQLRQILIGIKFGYSSPFADGFTQGFLLPDFVYTLLIGGAIQSTIIPFLSAGIEKGEEKKSWRTLSAFISCMSLLMAVVLGLVYLLLPTLLRYFTSESSYAAALLSAKALLPQAFFMMLAALLIGILNTYKKFIATALTPCIYNLLVLASLLLFADQSETALLYTSLGITAAAFVYFLIQLLLARHEIRQFRPRLGLTDPEVHHLFRLALPTLISGALPYASSFVISSYYRYFADGTSYAYSNAISTWQLPFGIVVIAITNVLLPHLSGLCAKKSFEEAGQMLARGLRMALLIMIPSALMFFFFREEVLRAIFSWGRPMEDSLLLTADIFRFYCLVILTQTLAFFLNNLFFANKLTWIPFVASVLNLLVLAGLSYPLVHRFQMGPSSMALSFAVASTVSLLFLMLMTKRSLPQIKIPQLGSFFLRLLPSILLLLAYLYFCRYQLALPLPTQKSLQLLLLSAKTLFGFLLFLLPAWLMGVKEIRHPRQSLRRS